jgi:hypothetical protein
VVSKCLSSATAFYKQAGIRGLQAPMAMARLPLLSWLSALTLKIGRFVDSKVQFLFTDEISELRGRLKGGECFLFLSFFLFFFFFFY